MSGDTRCKGGILIGADVGDILQYLIIYFQSPSFSAYGVEFYVVSRLQKL